MKVDPVYFDHAATTPLDPRVLEAMMPFLTEIQGNPSSVHGAGRRARHAVESAREEVADLLGAEPSEIVFTSGGTEADNTALRGVVRAASLPVVTSAAEHEAVLRTAERLRDDGHPVTILRPSDDGSVTVSDVERAMNGQPALVSVMHANNEVGTLSPVRALADACHAAGGYLHSDAVQTAGVLPLDVDALGVDLLTISAHKFYGPKGVGVLYVRAGTPFEPVQRGGAQERGRRGGTENVAAIVGLAHAFRLAVEEAEERRAHLAALRSRLIAGLRARLGYDLVLNSPLDPDAAVPHVVSISFPPRDGRPVDGEMLLLNMDMEGVLVSAGSACTSGALEPSHVLLAMGRDRATAAATIRFSPGKDTRESDVDFVVDALERVYRRMTR
ncbi:MAG TPA: cysteine desulfurase family protein [Rhodothermales bacterium]